MKKLILFFLLLATMPALAQSELKFGYLSYNAVMQAMPEYAAMQNSMAELRQKYEAEQKRVEDDFNKKYEEFLDGQKSYPKTILQKRQSELQEMLDKNIAFKKESQRLLAEAETKQYQTLRTRIQGAVETVAKAQNLCFVLNTDTGAFTWMSAEKGEDITEAVKQLLK